MVQKHFLEYKYKGAGSQLPLLSHLHHCRFEIILASSSELLIMKLLGVKSQVLSYLRRHFKFLDSSNG